MGKQSEEGSTGFPDFGDNVDVATFEQILEMDDDEEEREFSKSIVFDFFQQADSTFDKMDENMCVSPPPLYTCVASANPQQTVRRRTLPN